MRDLIKINGVNEYFCDIIFVTGLYINGVKRDSFPRKIHWLLSEIRQQGPQSTLLKKYRRNMSLLMMNIGNLYNCVDEIYGSIKVHNYLFISKEFINDFDIMQSTGYIPNKYVIQAKYAPCIIHPPFEDIYFTIVKIKPQAISYLKQKLDKYMLKKFDKMIRLLEMMGKQHKDNVDFDKYIDGWAEKLLDDSKW